MGRDEDEDGLYEDEEDWDEEDWDEEEEGEYVTGTIESFNEDGTANMRISDDPIPAA